MPRSLAVVLFMAVSLHPSGVALTGSADSGTGMLETVKPVLVSAVTQGERAVSVTFSEQMLQPGIVEPENFSVSMPGAGTLAPHPSGVNGTGPYELTWERGEMLGGAPLKVTVSGVQDLLGNPIDMASASASAVGVGSPPEVSGLNVSPVQADSGETVTLVFAVSEALDGDPVVTVNNRNAVFAGTDKAGNYIYQYVVTAVDPAGPAPIAISAMDLAGNVGSLTDTTALTIVQGAQIPLSAWPAAMALLIVGAAVLLRAGRRGSALSLLLFAVLLTPAAIAAGPTVSNVAFVQRSDGAGGTTVDISYDLDAPGGPCAITVHLSKNGGADGYSHAATTVSGDVSGVVTGAGYHVLWNIGADYPGETIPLARIRVTADDNAPVTYTFTYLAGAHGSVSGASPQTVAEGADGASVVALADTGYHFVNWSDGSVQNPRKDIHAASNITVTANFAITTYTLAYYAGANGTLSGVTPQVVPHNGSGTQVAAVADPGYRFLKWSDNSVQNPRTDTNVTSNRSVTASFVQTHTLNYAAGANGSISGAASQVVDHGGNGQAVSAVADSGCHFVNWSDGSVQNPRTDTGVTADIAVTATFAPNLYTLTYTAGAHGSVTGISPQSVSHGANGSAVSAVPDTHYHFVNWSDGSVQNPRTDIGVTAAVSVSANFAVTFDIGKVVDVASGSWVSSFWGHNAPKVAYDGTSYYTVSLDGAYGSAKGAVHRYQGGVWTKGYEWTLNYQPPMVMVDDTGRIVIVYANSSGSPTILRSNAAGDINNFTAVNAAPVTWAGYMGAGIYGHKLVLGYINNPNTYSFWVAAVDLVTGVWTAPKMLAQHVPGALPTEVSWLYPVIVPRADGIHMAVANNADANNLYNEVKYMKLDYSLNYLVNPETVDSVPAPFATNYAFQDSMMVGSDNAVYLTSRNLTGSVSHTCLHRRDGVTGAWTHNTLDALGFSAAMTFPFESAADPGRLWLTRQSSDRLYLYSTTNGGASWNTESPDSFAGQGLVINFVHGILQGSSPVLPSRPTVVFTASPSQPYSIWFLQWRTD